MKKHLLLIVIIGFAAVNLIAQSQLDENYVQKNKIYQQKMDYANDQLINDPVLLEKMEDSKKQTPFIVNEKTNPTVLETDFPEREIDPKILEQKQELLEELKSKQDLKGDGTFVSESDSLALVALYNSTNGQNWNYNTNWLTGPVNSWYGIEVNSGAVTEINLDQNNLYGQIPWEIGNLSSLLVLNLEYNTLFGAIPNTIGNLSSLQEIWLGYNYLSGSIPAEIGNLTSLSWLVLYINNLSGSIPVELGNLSSLQFLILEMNRLTGSIPNELGNLTSLNYLWLDYNQLTGSIPAELGNLNSLTYLLLNNNQLTGAIPTELANASSLYDLALDDNQLEGSIPAEINNLSNLAYFYINNNLLTDLPDLTSTNISRLKIENNIFTFGDFDNTGIDFSTLSTISYSPQAKISEPTQTDNGDGTTTLTLTTDGSGNTYQWYNDGTELTGETSNELVLSNSADEGIFYCLVSNSNYPDLILETIPAFFNQAGICGIPEEEYNALEAIYNATNGDNWTDNTNWLTEEDVENWFGIETNGGHVTEIDLYGNNLSGELIADLTNLSYLRLLNLGNNQLVGEIPIELGALSSLEDLNISYNQLTGAIPTEIGNLINLNYFYLHGNLLTGSIPGSIGNLANLENLYLRDNQLSGSIPSSIGNLNSLRYLDLTNNNLSGAIPSEIGNISALYSFNAFYNQLTGSIPSELGNCSDLRYLRLDNNQLSGSVPVELNSLTNLYNVDISSNLLSTLPVLDATSLNYLYVDDNEFTFGDLENTGLTFSNLNYAVYAPQGKLPEPTQTDNGDGTTTLTVTTDGTGNTYQWFDNTGILAGETTNTLDVDNTQEAYYYCQVSNPTYPDLTLETEYATFNIALSHGIVEEEYNVLVTFYNGTNGESWHNNTNWLTDAYVEDWYGITVYDGHVTGIELVSNNLGGTIPVELSLLDSIRSLDIHGNNISGEIPSELGSYTKIENLELWANQLTGDIPVSLGNLTTLTNLDIGINPLTGTIPPELGNLVNLESLWLNNSNIEGTIPSELGNITNLGLLGLEVCQLEGNIPAELGNLSNLHTLYLYTNQLSGNIPKELGNLSNLTGLYLYSNELSGQIPSELGNLSNLKWLYLYDNQLSGTIPVELGNLTNLLYLNLKNNALTGSVPSELGNLTNLRNLDLFNNQLTGSIPSALGNCISLTSLTLSNNQFSGSIPAELGNLTGLTYLSLKSNELTGNIPVEIGNLTNMVTLSFRYNNLDGAIPAELTNLTNLESLYLSRNQLTGCTDLSALTRLNILQIEENQFTFGDLESTNISLSNSNYIYSPQAELPEPTQTPSGDNVTLSFITDGTGNTYQWFKDGEAISGETTNSLTVASTESGIFHCEVYNSNFPLLTLSTKAIFLNSTGTQGVTQAEYDALVAFYNSTNGDNWTNNSNWLSAEDVTDWFGVTVVGGHISEIVFEQNNLTGTLPAEIGDLVYTEKLSISELGEGLTGTIPGEIGNMSNLKFLKLYNNDLTGAIPSSIGTLLNLETLDLSYNRLTEVPAEIGNLSSLLNLYLRSNEFTAVPAELGNLSSLFNLYLDNNKLTGSLNETISNIDNLLYLRLNNNELTALPDLSSLSNLQYIYLDNNQLTFEDLEASKVDFNSLTSYDYIPQANLKMVEQNNLVNEGESYTISCDNIASETLTCATNLYAVYKDGEVIRNWSLDPDYTINSFSSSNAGEYTIQVKNSSYSGLILYCDTMTVHINNSPSDITLSNLTVEESLTSGSTVGSLTTIDDDGDTHIYTLVTGDGTNDADNSSFTISSDVLTTATTLDFETQDEYHIFIQTEDANGLTYQKAFVITVTNVNETPTNLELSNNAIDENIDEGSTVGQFTTVDQDNGDSHTYSFATGNGTNDADNAAFLISGDELKTNAEIDYETQSEYRIYIQTEDASGLTYSKSFVINVNDLNDGETGLDDLISRSLKVYPNPCKENLKIELDANEYEINIYDIIGNKIYEEISYTKKHDIYLNDIPSGTYFIVIKYNDIVLNEKLIVK